MGTQRFRVGKTELLLYYGEPSPYSGLNEIYMEFLPADDYVNSGEWNIILIPEQIVTGQYEMWLPVSYVLNEGTAFFYPTEERTLTIPSTSSRVLTVGAYDATAMTYADFSGRGKKTRTIRNPILPRPESMSSPSRDRAGTLLYRNLLCHTICGRRSGSFDGMGNDRKNDPFLYGEKAKAYLRRGARQLPGFEVWPNNQLGYGALCVRDSIPETRLS